MIVKKLPNNSAGAERRVGVFGGCCRHTNAKRGRLRQGSLPLPPSAPLNLHFAKSLNIFSPTFHYNFTNGIRKD
jgi:hypothetical protein